MNRISNDLFQHIRILSDKLAKVLHTQIRNYCLQLWAGGWSVRLFLAGARQGRNEGDSWDEEGASAHCQEKKAGLQQDSFFQSQSKKSPSLIKTRHWETDPQVCVLKYLKSVNLLFLFGTRRNCLRSGRSRSLYPSIKRAIKQTVVIIEAYHFCQLRKKFYPASCCQG